MDLSFIQEQLDNFSTFGGAIEDIFDALRELFGYDAFDPETGDVAEGPEGNLNNLSSYLEGSSNAEADADVDGDDAGEGSSLPGSSEENGAENGDGDDAEGDA
ncbi:PorH family porin [Corynebacterium halotolerans]|uniref:Uncharacterized protein n=1 Tax=Corynebacterium halotolerans YIM 70093 = DSM 44683 TaxID=1121362 RepID=M1P130_9CORY|nr:PorH family porin [Corynebacterium halotolerans]AGF73470.1 hypothetical protein A605_12370 [Corynebacterium halotolerans YIM 70093 = DSM 44683]